MQLEILPHIADIWNLNLPHCKLRVHITIIINMAITNEELLTKIQQGSLYFANLVDECVDESVYSLDVNYEL